MARPSTETVNQLVPYSYVASNGFHTEGFRVNSVKYTRNYTGTTTPNFAYLRSVGRLPVNNHEVKITYRTTVPLRRYQYLVSDPGQWDDYTDLWNIVLPVSAPDYSYDLTHSSLAYETAVGKVQDKVKDMKVNVAQAFAERQQTIDLFTSTASSIARAISAARKGNMKQAAKALGIKNPKSDKGKDLAQKWLALQYGWKPLLSDLTGAVEHIASKEFPPVLKFHGVGRAHNSALRHVTQGTCEIIATELQYESKATVVLEYYAGNQTSRTLSQLGISDPLLLAWELLPYSFVVDWFLPVGAYLSRLCYDNGLNFKSGRVTKFSTNQWSTYVSSKSEVVSGYNVQYFGGEVLHSSNAWLTRYSILYPPSAILPSFKNPLTPGHIANALSLLRVAFR